MMIKGGAKNASILVVFNAIAQRVWLLDKRQALALLAGLASLR